jgi:SagB-type dehydrogenase family enzyme
MPNTAKIMIILSLLFALAAGQSVKTVELLKPDTTGGMPLMQALKERQSNRDFSTDTLSLKVLSNLLWAACGINRAGSGKRTAPSAMNWQEIDVYITTAKGAYLYDYKNHKLVQTLEEDIRAKTGGQEYVKDAPINLVYVSDYAKAGDMPDSVKAMYTTADAGFIAENVYLFCASEGLSTVVRGYVDKEALAKLMKLRPTQHIVLAQTVGYPKK